MTFYSVHRTCEGGSSAGYEWFSTKRDAERAAAQWPKDNPDERAEVACIKIEPTRQGLLRALNLLASHPNNG